MRIVSGIIAAILVGLFLFSPHTTGPTEVGVRTIKWGLLAKKGVDPNVYEPGGVYFFPAVINDWHTFDTKLHNIEMTFDPRRSAAFTWAVMVTRNKCIDRLRIRQRFARIAEKAAVEEQNDPKIDDASTGIAELNEERGRVRAALDQVTPDQRQAIEMAFFNDFTHEEIAARLSTPLGTVKARIRRGLLKLREILEAHA